MGNIQHLINQVFKERKEDTFDRNTDLAEQLHNCGPKVVDPILDELFAQKRSGKLRVGRKYGSSVFHLIDVLKKFVKPKHAQQLAEMLLWDEITFEKERSIRSFLVEALKEIGNTSVVSLLENYAKKVKEVEYSNFRDVDPRTGQKILIFASRYHQWDQKEIAETIAACQKR